VARTGFDGHVVSLILLMNFKSFTKSHLGGDFAVAIAHALSMLFEKFGKFGFCYPVMRCLE
jgi:hypothetical protein